MHAAMAYYFDHQEEIECEIETECREADEAWQKSSGFPLRARLRARGLNRWQCLSIWMCMCHGQSPISFVGGAWMY